MDRDVLEGGRVGARIHSLEQHGAPVLVEEFGSRVDVVVSAGVRAANYHHRVPRGCGRGGVVDAVVVYRGLEEVGVGFKPG